MSKTKIFNTDDNDCDGHLFAGNTICECIATNTATTMRCGCVGSSKCVSDNKTPDYRSYMSFPTGYLNGWEIISAKLYFYVASITQGSGWIWNEVLSPLLEIVCAKNHMEDALDISDWAIGATDEEMAVPSAVGWYSIDLTDYIFTDGDTDICLRPNVDWNTNADDQGKRYWLNITTNEGGANKPYLEIVGIPVIDGNLVLPSRINKQFLNSSQVRKRFDKGSLIEKQFVNNSRVGKTSCNKSLVEKQYVKSSEVKKSLVIPSLMP